MPSTLTYGISYPSGSATPNVPLSMQTSAESVEAALTALAPTPATATYLNGWTAFGSGYQALTFTKVGKIVTITGMIKPGTTTTGIAVANIPAGYLPAANHNQNVGSAVAGPAYASTTIAQFSTGGTVLLFNIPSGTSYIMFNNTYVTA